MGGSRGSGKLAGPAALVALLVVGPALLGAQPSEETGPGDGAPAARTIDGVSLVAPRGAVPTGVLGPVAALGAEWVAVVPYAFVRREDAVVRFDRRGQFRGERSEGVREQIEEARRHGLRVMLKPHLWVRGEGWAGSFVPREEAGWKAFEESYRAYLMAMATIAEEEGVEILCVGTELSRLVAERPGFFRRLVEGVRRIYGGEVTYAANWDAYDDVPFWDALDYVGVDAYFPLSGEEVPSIDGLVARWGAVRDTLRGLSRRTGKPILFTEFGYRSVAGAAGRQWELPPEEAAVAGRDGALAQARAYEALFRVWWDEPWFAGGFLWKWHLEGPDRGWGSVRSRDAGYTPQGKPAEQVIRRWFERP